MQHNESQRLGSETADLDLVTVYLDQISRTPLLDAMQEVELAKQIEVGQFAGEVLLARQAVLTEQAPPPIALELGKLASDVSDDELAFFQQQGSDAKWTMVESNLRLVVSIAKKYPELSMMERVSAGNMGLIHAVEKFDFTKGFKFSTYATRWIKEAVQSAIATEAYSFGPSVHVMKKLPTFQRIVADLTTELGRPPTCNEIVANSKLKNYEARALHRFTPPNSLDVLVGWDRNTSLYDLISISAGQVEGCLFLDDDARMLPQLLRALPERDQDIVCRSFGLSGEGRRHTSGEIGKAYNLTSARVRQIITRSLTVMREKARTQNRRPDFSES